MRAAAAGALFCILGALALPAAAGHDEWTSVPEETEQVCRPLPSGPPAPTCDGGNERGVILVGGSAPSEGSVRICHDNEFRSVCDDFATHRSAGVVCRQLGYATGVPTLRSHFVGVDGPVSYWLDDVDCRGTEANLGDCYHPGWGLDNCGASERLGVICMTRVTGLRATAGKRQVSLAWDEPRSRYDGGFTGHEYRYKTLSEDGYGPWQAIPDSAATEANVASYTVTGLFEGTWYSFQVRILGGGNASDPGTAGVRTAGEANRLPEFAGPQKRSVAENTAAGAAVGAPVTASDADGETLRYSLEAVGDHASFTIEPSSGQIRTRAVHDHEARNRYSVTVKADDGEGGTGTVAVAIEIADVEEQPTDAEIVTGPGSDGVWSAGERVEARVRFGVPVRVAVPAGGRAPELLLAFYGGGGRVGSFGRAAYTGGSGTDTLSLAYTVTEADAGAGSVVVPRNALRSGDASIEHASGAPARARAGVSRPSPAPEGGTMAFRVSLARAAAYPVAVDYATADGTATEGEDYRAVRDTLTFAPGETEKTVEVPLLADTAAEGDETLTLRLSNARSSPPQEVSVDISPDEAEGTIADAPGAAEAAQAVSPLTARFEGMPEAHAHLGPVEIGMLPAQGHDLGLAAARQHQQADRRDRACGYLTALARDLVEHLTEACEFGVGQEPLAPALGVHGDRLARMAVFRGHFPASGEGIHVGQRCERHVRHGRRLAQPRPVPEDCRSMLVYRNNCAPIRAMPVTPRAWSVHDRRSRSPKLHRRGEAS